MRGFLGLALSAQVDQQPLDRRASGRRLSEPVAASSMNPCDALNQHVATRDFNCMAESGMLLRPGELTERPKVLAC